MPRRVELLSPAGDLECLDFAFRYGADAVYLGAKEFGMRSSAANFTDKELSTAVQLAHSLGKRIYLALNTVPTNEEVPHIPGLLYRARNIGVDAFIIADLGVLRMAHQYVPGSELHLSTQAGVMNHATANAAHELGVKRVVLARELSLEEIAVIRNNTPKSLELEAFVHGSMCMSVSGRCLLSHHMIGRDSNRGQCAQPCRWKYSLMEEKRPGQYFPVDEDEDGSYILSADDLCAAGFLDQIIDAGVTSLKIEGRGKSFYYVASTTAAYRAALDAALTAPRGQYQAPDFTVQELSRTSHRPYSSGFYFGYQGATQSPKQEGYIRQWQPVGIVQRQEDGRVYCQQRGKLMRGDELEALLPSSRIVAFTASKIMNKEGNAIKSTPQTKMEYALPAIPGEDFPPGTILRREIE